MAHHKKKPEEIDLITGTDFMATLEKHVKKGMIPGHGMSKDDAKGAYDAAKSLFAEIEGEMVVEEKEKEQTTDVIEGLVCLFGGKRFSLQTIWHLDRQGLDDLLFLLGELPTVEGTPAYEEARYWIEAADEILEAVETRLLELMEEEE